MRLTCVGCGPGDPELLTIKALDRLKAADVIFGPTAREGKPSIAIGVVERYIDRRRQTVRTLIFPMKKEKESLVDYWKKNASEIAESVYSSKNVVYLTVGDPSLYSTWAYVSKELREAFPDIEIEIIPGITSIFSFAAEAKLSLAEGEQTVGIIPACYDIEKVKETAGTCDTVIFLKDGRYFGEIIHMLPQAGFGNNSMVTIAQDVSVNEQIINTSQLQELQQIHETGQKYFSIMVVKKK
jgi:precorrin-2/cobalt-factor-2 C20-methyltransferase